MLAVLCLKAYMYGTSYVLILSTIYAVCSHIYMKWESNVSTHNAGTNDLSFKMLCMYNMTNIQVILFGSYHYSQNNVANKRIQCE